MTNRYVFSFFLIFILIGNSVHGFPTVAIESEFSLPTKDMDIVDYSSSNRAKNALAVIMLSELQHIYDGSPKKIKISTFPEGVKTKVLYNGEESEPTKPGIYLVEAYVIDPNFEYNSVKDLLIIVDVSTIKLKARSNICYLYDPNSGFIVIRSAVDCTVKIYDGYQLPIYETNGFSLMNISTGDFDKGDYKVNIITKEEDITYKIKVD